MWLSHWLWYKANFLKSAYSYLLAFVLSLLCVRAARLAALPAWLYCKYTHVSIFIVTPRALDGRWVNNSRELWPRFSSPSVVFSSGT